jgi:ABC-2 type transport system permease protein
MVVAAVAAALFGFRPASSALAWIVVAYAVILGMSGALMNLPDLIADLSPFAHTTAMPLGDVTLTPLALLTALAVVLAVAVGTSFRRRDLEST